MLLKEYKVKLNNPSDPGSEMGKKEQMVTLDGEIFQLKQPEFHARLVAFRSKKKVWTDGVDLWQGYICGAGPHHAWEMVNLYAVGVL